MSETQITYPVWNNHHSLSWRPSPSLGNLPKWLTDLLVERLGSPFVLFRIRADIYELLRDLPAEIAARPLVEIDVRLSERAKSRLETETSIDVYRIGQWLTDQFSSLRFRELVGRQVPSVVVHLWQASASPRATKEYELLPSWTTDILPERQFRLSPITGLMGSPRGRPISPIRYGLNSVTAFGIEELAECLHCELPVAVRVYTLLAYRHVEFASIHIWNGTERLWVRHRSFHETWKVSENISTWDAVARDAWVPILDGNILVLGRVLPVAGGSGQSRMAVLPGSLFIRVSNDA